MNKLLTVTTMEPVGLSIPHAMVRVYADAILYADCESTGGYTARYNQPDPIYAMSIIGPEQAIRAIGAGCCNKETYRRMRLSVVGDGGRSVVGRWQGPWFTRAVMLTRGAMHMVAMPEVAGSKLASTSDHVIIATTQTKDELRRELYRRLCLCYSTPLIHLDHGDDEERKVAETWMRRLTDTIMQDGTKWARLKTHPDQTDRAWSMAGRLSLTQETLDDMVSRLVRNGSLPFPRRSGPRASNSARAATSLSA